jgi:serpin B
MSSRTLIALFLALVLLAAACGTESEPTTTPSGPDETTTSGAPTPTTPVAAGELVRADLPRATATGVTDEEIAQLVAGNAEFAFDLFRVIAGDENTMLSPNSIAAALTMTYGGARTTTAEEMRTVLRLALLDERIHAARNELDLRVNAEPPVNPADDSQPFAIRTSNSVWGQPGYPFLDAFLELLATDYDAGVQLADFASDPDGARVAINDWVEERTEGRIEDLIPPGVINQATRLVLVNAIWFKANWANQFDPAQTAPGPFTLLDGSTVGAEMMHGTSTMRYATGDGWESVTVPYAGDADMVVVLPDLGRFAEIAAGFGPEDLAAITAGAEVRSVDLTMPKFEFVSEFGLKEPLRTLGMVEAFNPPPGEGTADFTGITAERELFVQDVVHKSFIKVDEQGTEAAAATAVIIGLSAAPPPATMTLDHPFLFVIQHRSTGEILFIGQVTNPVA